MGDRLADVIAEARLNHECPSGVSAIDRQIAVAVRAAGYRSPEEIAEILRVEEERWQGGAAARLFLREPFENLRVALLGRES